MRRSRYSQALLAAAALAAPLLASADPRYAVTAVAGADSWASDINNLGQVVGSMFVTTPDDSYRHGYTMTGGAVTDLGTLPYGDVVGAAANMVGRARNYPDDPFLYHDDVMTGLGNLGMDPFSIPGELYPTTDFLYDSSGMHVLGGGAASGWTITGAAAINDLQQIAAQACRAGVCQAVTLDLVSCVPEPPLIALLAAGLALGLARGGPGMRGVRLPVRRRRG